jgi:GNAT superfamily N-acetyltransferase
MSDSGFTAPAPLAPEHDLELFSCGEESLDRWLKERARKAEGVHSARTYVVCAGKQVVGYYCLATGAVVRSSAPKPLQRNMPDPLPAMILGRLAIDQNYQRFGLGRALLRDAVLRTANVARQAGIVALIAHAISPEAKAFYLRNEFEESPLEDMTVLLPLRKVYQNLQDES